MVDGGGVDRPVAVRKLPELHRVVAHRRQAVTAGLPGQQHLAGLDVLLRDGGTAGGLGTSWTNTHREGACYSLRKGMERMFGGKNELFLEMRAERKANVQLC